MDTKIKSTAGLNFVSDGNFHWAGATYRRLGGAGTYNPRVPVLVGTGNKSRAVGPLMGSRWWSLVPIPELGVAVGLYGYVGPH